MRVLIGYDGSKSAERALKDLERAGIPKGSQMLVLTVAAPFGSVEPAVTAGSRMQKEARAAAEAALEEAGRQAEKAAAKLATRFPACRVSSEACIGDAATVILDRAKAWKADLLALGSHGRTALGRLLMGSVSHKVLHHLECGLRITRNARSRGGKGLRILVAVDGSLGSLAAVDAAASREWPAGTAFRLVAALDGKRLEQAVSRLRGRKDGWLEEQVRSALERLKAAGWKADRVFRTGDARLAVLREAAGWRAHGIFLGSRGLGRWEGIALGSVSAAVATHAPCTVEVVARRKRTGGGA